MPRNVRKNDESDDEQGGPGTTHDTSQSITISPQVSWVQVTVGNKLIDFLIDVGGYIISQHLIQN